MTNPLSANNQAPNQPEEQKYPEREISFEQTNAKDRKSGTICYKFAQDFRHSCFYFTLGLNQQREQILIPPRSQLIQHISEYSPNYQYPSCLSNKDLTIEEKIKKSTGETSETIKFKYKGAPLPQEDDQLEEDQEDQEDEDDAEKKQHKNTDSDQQEEDHEEDNEDDRVGDYLIAQYDDGNDDMDHDDDDDYGD